MYIDIHLYTYSSESHRGESVCENSGLLPFWACLSQSSSRIDGEQREKVTEEVLRTRGHELQREAIKSEERS